MFDEGHGDYLYKPALVERIVRETVTADHYKSFLKIEAKFKF